MAKSFITVEGKKIPIILHHQGRQGQGDARKPCRGYRAPLRSRSGRFLRRRFLHERPRQDRDRRQSFRRIAHLRRARPVRNPHSEKPGDRHEDHPVFQQAAPEFDQAITQLTFKGTAEEDPEHLYNIGEYYLKKRALNHAAYAFQRYVQYCPAGPNRIKASSASNPQGSPQGAGESTGRHHDPQLPR